MTAGSRARADEHVAAGKVLKRFWPDLWRHRWRMVAAYGCGLMAILATLAAPWPLKLIIDNVLGTAPAPAWLQAMAAGTTDTMIVIALSGALLAIGVIGTVFAGLEQYVNARNVERLTLEIRDRLLRHVQRLPLAYRTSDQSGEIGLRLVDDVAQFVRLLCKSAPTAIRQLMTAVAALAALLWLQPLFGLLGLIIIVIISVLTRRFARPLQRASKVKRRCEGAVAGIAQEIVRGLPSAMALSAEQKIRQRFVEANTLSLEAGVQEARRAVSMERTLEIVKAIGGALILCGGALLVLRGQMTVGDLTVGIAYLANLMRPMAKVNEMASSISRGLARGEQLAALLDRTPEIVDASDALGLDRARGHIEFRGVGFGYRAANSDAPPTAVLQDVSLSVAPGEFVVAVGPSGAGKSTLLHLLLRFYDPTQGEILLDGIPIHRIRVRDLRAQFAPMLQETHLFSGTIREALLPALRDADDDEIWSALEKVRMAEFVAATPGGLDASLAENGINLSGGQRARLSLARALLTEAPILLLDEPLANVDPYSQDAIVDALAGLRGRRTCVAVTHQPALTRLADHVIEIENARVRSVSVEEHRAKLRVAG
ncbi:MAG: ABC transporter ATP-binding protein [Alphaproteobacteria bacterium]